MPCPECTRLLDALDSYNKRYSRQRLAHEQGCQLWELHRPKDNSIEYSPKPVWSQTYDTIGLQQEMLRHVAHCNFHKKHTGNGTYSGPFAFTLTKSPTDTLTVGDMLKAVDKIMNQKSCPVIQYAWYLEYKGKDEDGLPIHPHIHGMYETESQGRIEAKHFKRAWPIWKESVKLGKGHRGGYHEPIKAEDDYANYIKKDGGIGKCLIQSDE